MNPHLVPQKPLVVLLDLDGTLAGKVNSVLCEYEVHNSIGSKGRSSKNIRDAIVSRLRYGIIRPHVVDFCKGVADMGTGIELFVFTASENTWANFFVPCVESALGVRFNRPIFTRNHCVIKEYVTTMTSTSGGGGKGGKGKMYGGGVNVLKSIVKLRPQIFRSLKGRYPGLQGPNDLVDRVILVDNTPQVMADPRESARLVVCPTYNYSYVYDVLAQLPVDVLHSDFSKTVPVLQRNGMFPTGTWLSAGPLGPSGGQPWAGTRHSSQSTNIPTRRIDTYSSFAAVYYRRLARLLDAAAEPNDVALGYKKQRSGGDRFFMDLLNALKSLLGRRFGDSCFDDSGVKELSLGTTGQRRLSHRPR